MDSEVDLGKCEITVKYVKGGKECTLTGSGTGKFKYEGATFDNLRPVVEVKLSKSMDGSYGKVNRIESDEMKLERLTESKSITKTAQFSNARNVSEVLEWVSSHLDIPEDVNVTAMVSANGNATAFWTEDK